jgi:hypothetical protein
LNGFEDLRFSDSMIRIFQANSQQPTANRQTPTAKYPSAPPCQNQPVIMSHVVTIYDDVGGRMSL